MPDVVLPNVVLEYAPERRYRGTRAANNVPMVRNAKQHLATCAYLPMLIAFTMLPDVVLPNVVLEYAQTALHATRVSQYVTGWAH